MPSLYAKTQLVIQALNLIEFNTYKRVMKVKIPIGDDNVVDMDINMDVRATVKHLIAIMTVSPAMRGHRLEDYVKRSIDQVGYLDEAVSKYEEEQVKLEEVITEFNSENDNNSDNDDDVLTNQVANRKYNISIMREMVDNMISPVLEHLM